MLFTAIVYLHLLLFMFTAIVYLHMLLFMFTAIVYLHLLLFMFTAIVYLHLLLFMFTAIVYLHLLLFMFTFLIPAPGHIHYDYAQLIPLTTQDNRAPHKSHDQSHDLANLPTGCIPSLHSVLTHALHVDHIASYSVLDWPLSRVPVAAAQYVGRPLLYWPQWAGAL